MKGKFITFEGADGGGKCTQVQLAAEWRRKQGYEVVTTETELQLMAAAASMGLSSQPKAG